MDIKGKTAIVTGGASGLGAATVERYAADGANVAIFDLNEDAGNALADRLGPSVAFFAVNVTEEASVQAGIDAVVEKFGALHIVNNYAGIGPACKTYGKKGPHPIDLYMTVVMVNQVGTFNVSRLAAEKMAANEPMNNDGARGVIINTASVAAYEGQVGQVAYSATKGAIVGMTLPMARELAYYGIRVNTIVPGLIHTPLFDTIEESYYKSLEASTVYPQRLGKTSEIAKLSAHIVDNDYLNGECIRVDAGVRMQPK
ncbi:SDR family NAD(P)-dependent oxidoreductase [Microbulbifer sp. SAOS-129_SWC]|uniref:SDR family NAD(P)-dependent oxidoreductase n=1 Tax=Microbulbifer sp. SAOS-129_SWC TaxID=3145235 RepID=UPI0032172AC0